MAPKNVSSTPNTTLDSCAPKTYGVPARPADINYRQDLQDKKPAVSKSSGVTGAGKGVSNTPFNKPENAFVHEKDNIVANAATSATSSNDNFDNINLKLQFQPNILDTFDAITYHFKLFITDPDTSSNGDVFNESKQIIIAESGVTDLTIDKVEIRSISTPTVETGTGLATHIKFEIVEPSGAGLIDKIFYQSVALGIGNWAVMPVYLQLQFKGRDPLTSSPADGAPGSLSALKWLWTIKLTSIKAHVTHVGTRYEFESIVYNDFAQSNLNFSIQHNVVLDNLDNIADAMNKLQDKLNADQYLKLIANYSIPDTYRIVVDPKIAGYKITPPDKNINSRRSDSFDGDYKTATFQSGTGIDKIIDTLLSNTREYQKAMINAPVAGADGLPMNEQPSQMKKFWRIITETRPLKFDVLRNTIANEFVIYVIEYDIGVLDQNTFQTSSEPNTIAAQRKRLMTYVKKSILRKRYDYIFTGINDQVINFDITINNAFANSQARFGGVFVNPAISDTGVVKQEVAQEEIRVTAAVSKAIALQNNAKAAEGSAAQAAFEEARQEIEFSRIPEDLRNRYRNLLEKSKPDTRLSYMTEIQAAGGISFSGDLNSVRNEAQRLSTPINEKITQKQFNFISDIEVNSSKTKKIYENYIANARGKLRPIARAETIQDRQTGPGLESDSNSGLQKLSTMFAVALHSGLDASFQKIKLTIKGDPFWLVTPPYEGNQEKIYNTPAQAFAAIDKFKNRHKTSPYVNIYGTDNFFLIRFRTPQVFEGSALENNADTNTDVETLSGVYKATIIHSRFDSGKFTQELEAILDPEIRVLDIYDQIEQESQKTSPTSPTDTVDKIIPIPLESIKTDKIMGSITDQLGNVTTGISEIAGKVTTTVGTAGGSLIENGSALLSNIPTEFKNPIPGGPPFFG